jgi:nucleoside 2-deoxyribosyltransferase
MLIYFAGPLFSQAERAFNLQLTKKLEERGYTVFLPQRDGVEIHQTPYNEMAGDEVRKVIFATDRDKVLKADALLFVLDGRVPDEGACVELGMAYGQKYLTQADKLLIGLLTDMRGGFPGGKLNAMIHGALDYVAEDEKDLISALEVYRYAKTEGGEAF